MIPSLEAEMPLTGFANAQPDHVGAAPETHVELRVYCWAKVIVEVPVAAQVEEILVVAEA